MFFDCPEYLNHEGSVRCGLPAEVRCRFTIRSSDGPLESVMIRCPASHWFNGPIESLTLPSRDRRDRGTAAVASSISRDNLRGGHDRQDRHGHCRTGAERLT